MGNFSNLLLELVDCWKHGVLIITGTIAIVLMELKNRNLALTAGIAVGVKSQVVFNSLYSLLTSLMKLTLTCVWRVWKMFKVSANFKNHAHLKDHILKIFKVAYTTHSVKPLIKNTSKEFIKCRILIHFLMLECCRYLVFN